ncbi:LysR family transcriptional regulator [Cronobacter sakazakii]|uniref:LysR family transcriptional regulator n=1 Tax=Cronobacter sakazakii TaxID=28141 RepID=UPI000CFBD534|nr:LysR family transcriptional regulator [Cronobacter sakazakii]EKM1387855.1 LysR family transcriptional regulator [Cronobacter sakazakii]EKM6428944.1 LysR family transcriptional regulator [Cronobacter sakazakii]ELY7522769.1 LysR family transcriptional regulator [Cronobacter sakazakii]ELZ1660776.1 LysR family transcriptional regulator [Cronobacter sakazakii]UWT87387.1 LysR family transcriptional regulator [Cronobacter sakazakii]
MDIKVLRNLLKTAQMGSLTCAAEEANITIQALAAQLNKAEEYFGFKIFNRNNKGVVLTSEGKDLLPYIMNVVKTSEHLRLKAEQLKKSTTTPIRIALNSTFSVDTNKKIINFMIDKLSDYSVIFSTSESPENLVKIAKDETDIAVVLGGNVPPGFYSIKLTGLNIKVIAACSAESAAATTLVQPLAECPYSASFDKFTARHKPLLQEASVIFSGSELITVSLMKSFSSIGIISQDLAQANGLNILPGFEDVLDVHLIMKEPILTEHDLESFYNNVVHLPEIPLTA